MTTLLALNVYIGQAYAETKAWNFIVTLDDKPIGYHRFTLTKKENQQELKSTARFDVKILFISAYKYQHDATESWKDNCLSAMTSNTNDDGNISSVNTEYENNKLIVKTPKGSNSYSGCIMSFAYWNMNILTESRLLNAQTGNYESVRIINLPETQLTIRGQSIVAKHYRVETSERPIELWYSNDGDWLALSSIVKGGRRLYYQREN